MSGLAIAGHPLHPVAAIVPLALLAAGVALDARALFAGDRELWNGARWCLAGAALTGALVAIPGVRDLFGYPPPARAVPLRHGLANVAFLIAALASWALRPADVAPSPAALALSFAALAFALLGWRVGARLTPAPRSRADHPAEPPAPAGPFSSASR